MGLNAEATALAGDDQYGLEQVVARGGVHRSATGRALNKALFMHTLERTTTGSDPLKL